MMKNISIDPSAVVVESQFRSVPFWSWNDKLEKEELLRQIHEMHDAGMGGFFMHARGGLKIPYMGTEWMDAVSLCVREAAKLGMKPYLYDENGWPSGFGNGEVNGLGEEYQSKSVEIVSMADVKEHARVPAWYDEAGKMLPSREGAAFAAEIRINPFYTDNLNPRVVRTFLDKIYETYWSVLPEDVRNSLAGIFTDEPQLRIAGIPWSPALSEAYEKSYGEKLLPLLPELTRELGNWRQTRVRFWKTVTELFRNSYICQIGKWCREHGWELVGHHLMEESYDSQLNTGGCVMPQYAGYTIPGIDHLSRYSAYITSDMQVVSAAAQNGQRQILTETFGCSGWNFNMRGIKWLYQQHLVHGVNLLCQHLAGYSLHGLRKRDYPASIFYQHPMWKSIRPLNDAFGRVGRMLAMGEQECELLLIHGESTAWMRSHGHYQDRFSKKLFQEFCQLSQKLNEKGIPFHYGDELMISENGAVDGKRFRIGNMSYSRVVLPPVENLLKSTFTLLEKFVRQGGTVLKLASVEAKGFFVDGTELTAGERHFWESLPSFSSREALLQELADLPSLTIRNLGGIEGRVRGTWRRFPIQKERWYYLADFAFLPENRVPDNDFFAELHSNIPEVNDSCALEITLPFPAERADLIDQSSGMVLETIDLLKRPDGKCTFLRKIAASESLLIRALDPVESAPLDLSCGWKCHVVDNVMTLSKVSYRLDQESGWSEPLDTLAVFNRLLALPQDTWLELRYSFELLPELDFEKAELKIALEPDNNGEYFLNGHPLEKEFLPGYFIDRSIRMLVLPPSMLVHGINHLDVRTRFEQRLEIRRSLERAKHFEGEANKLYYDSEVEPMYLLGQFGCFSKGVVREEKKNCYFLGEPFVLGRLPESLDCGHAVTGGFPFFTGTLTLEKNFRLSAREAETLKTLELASFRANDAEIMVNGHAFPVMYAPPYQVNVLGLLREGENQIRIQYCTSCRNTMGPFHTPETEPNWTGPGAFLTEKDLLGWYCIPAVKEFGVLEFTSDKIELK